VLKKLLSFIIPINIYKQKSSISKTLELTWNNGKLVLDSENTNYSYGSLERVLRTGLKSIGFAKIKNMQNILVLGVAGGSVIRTLTDELHFEGAISGVDIDPEIIKIANDYFKLNEIPNLEITIDDASEFVRKTTKSYDLIIIDIFEDLIMPDFVFGKAFIDRLGIILKDKGFILFNTMILNEANKRRNLKYISEFEASLFTARKITKVEQHNELIIIEKLYLV